MLEKVSETEAQVLTLPLSTGEDPSVRKRLGPIPLEERKALFLCVKIRVDHLMHLCAHRANKFLFLCSLFLSSAHKGMREVSEQIASIMTE